MGTPLSSSNPSVKVLSDLIYKELLETWKFGMIIISRPFDNEQLEKYISSYWDCFDPLYPVIHCINFNLTEDRLLASAMATLGSQYHYSTETRRFGVQLNEHCRKNLDLVGLVQNNQFLVAFYSLLSSKC